MRKYILIIYILLANLNAFAQKLSYIQDYSVPVYQENRLMKYPFGGGIEIPQFSEVDLNNDGIKDLIIYDKLSNDFSFFLNSGIPNTILYTQSNAYEQIFPKPGIRNWVLTRDYNNDGLDDLFVGVANNKVRVWKNISNDINGLAFKLTAPQLVADMGTFIFYIAIQSTDIPSIVDVDGDGDLDVLTFESSIFAGGDGIYWYKNLSQEKYGHSDSLEFKLEKHCWGKFREQNSSCQVTLNYPEGVCQTGKKNSSPFPDSASYESYLLERNNMDGASTSLVFDANGDQKYDIIIGDMACATMYLLTNTGTNAEPDMTSYTNPFPNENYPVSGSPLPAAYYIDVNNDGKKDLISAPGSISSIDNSEHINLHLNLSTNHIPDFQFQSAAFIEEEMIDVGRSAFPHLFDYNNDGLLDLLIGNFGYHISENTYRNALSLYENIGTNTSPAFKLISHDYCNLSQLDLYGIIPSTGDIDNDQDPDLIVGSSDGHLYYFENIAQNNEPADFVFRKDLGIDIGQLSAAAIFDSDGDGKTEMIVTGRNSNVYLYEDTSNTVGNPQYKLITDSLGGFNFRAQFGFPGGYLVPYIGNIYKQSGFDLAFANANGNIYFYQRDSLISDAYTLKDSIRVGAHALINITGIGFTMGDLNGDNEPEIIIGTSKGGLLYYQNNTHPLPQSVAHNRKLQVHVYPNPAQNTLYLQSDQDLTNSRFELYNLIGNSVFSGNIEAKNRISLPVLTEGYYILKLNTNHESIHTKIFIKTF